ncbi:hypothetical protein GCM10017744_032250 [Streptomyces antimycoticus]|uniref:Uncharacterized protein n=1 Tax=Streptomyces antimycoticus TaxID=68175 RepID=A0A4D4KCV4_9ACTN|nr:hypothetical protein SANT12839_070240 [Streptomyces antimycoticus]
MRALPFDSDAPLRLAPSYPWEAPPAGQPKHPDTLRCPSAQSVAAGRCSGRKARAPWKLHGAPAPADGAQGV